MVNNKTIFLTGGTGSFGMYFTKKTLKNKKIKKLIIFSRDEMKQWVMKNEIKDKRLKFIIGDIRDSGRVEEITKNVDIIVHAAATKIVPTAEEFPSECIKTNVLGAINLIAAAKKNGVKQVIALSTDKACNPVNLYGATKLTSDKLFVSSNDFKKNSTKFSVVRYGNVINSRGSVIPFFKSFPEGSTIPITHNDMTRFMITLNDAVNLVYKSLNEMIGGEIFVRKAASINILDIAKSIHKNLKTKIIGIRPGEKIHEEMISINDARNTYEYKDIFKILPDLVDKRIKKKMIKNGKKVDKNFNYISNKNSRWISPNELKKVLENSH
mgnify:CR=1 FL=1|tara:strand:- start:1058 stop:2032 length:975 start_codon:yes stop_codon:yes gene_type:complete